MKTYLAGITSVLDWIFVYALRIDCVVRIPGCSVAGEAYSLYSVLSKCARSSVLLIRVVRYGRNAHHTVQVRRNMDTPSLRCCKCLGNGKQTGSEGLNVRFGEL